MFSSLKEQIFSSANNSRTTGRGTTTNQDGRAKKRTTVRDQSKNLSRPLPRSDGDEEACQKKTVTTKKPVVKKKR
jgi:hypothetical protein